MSTNEVQRVIDLPMDYPVGMSTWTREGGLHPLLWLVPLALLSGCPGGGLGAETKELCMDSKDNDGDGYADCDDSDCASLWICRQGQPRADHGPPPPPPDGATADRGTSTLDSGPPPASSFGQLCTWQGYPTLCPDGRTVCVRSPVGGAYCTTACSGTGTCPAGPGGNSVAECFYSYNDQTYCVFLCMLYGEPHDCPTAGYQCYESGLQSQKWCWPAR